MKNLASVALATTLSFTLCSCADEPEPEPPNVSEIKQNLDWIVIVCDVDPMTCALILEALRNPPDGGGGVSPGISVCTVGNCDRQEWFCNGGLPSFCPTMDALCEAQRLSTCGGGADGGGSDGGGSSNGG